MLDTYNPSKVEFRSAKSVAHKLSSPNGLALNANIFGFYLTEKHSEVILYTGSTLEIHSSRIDTVIKNGVIYYEPIFFEKPFRFPAYLIRYTVWYLRVGEYKICEDELFLDCEYKSMDDAVSCGENVLMRFPDGEAAVFMARGMCGFITPKKVFTAKELKNINNHSSAAEICLSISRS